ncbi:translation Initiation Factor [Nesidiocoris tenuis]|uniref:Translation initiation factor eIF2B subunit beta n=1 Tax=Nesidiocoris tenuis TaxID=355587 RepID=A0ABN7BA25_9HEMI|nr:translation Initiation Factor [Nesidiocoris tenuis]
MIDAKVPVLDEKIVSWILDVKEGKCKGDAIILGTVRLMKEVVNDGKWKNAQELMSSVREVGRAVERRLSCTVTEGSSSANVIRRVLRIVREEYLALGKKEAVEESLHKMLTPRIDGTKDEDDYGTLIPNLGAAILDHLNELEIELETSSENIAAQASEHIHNNEVIMTLGNSKILADFFKGAAKERKFEVLVAKTEPSCAGLELAQVLHKAKIQTNVVPDSNIFSIMSRVNKVIIGTDTVMANGGLRSICGSHLMALAAAHYSVPVLVLAPLHQLSPQFLCSPNQPSFNTFLSPHGVLDYTDSDLLAKVDVYNPKYDYVPPDLVTLFVSNTGGHTPSYIYRHLTELYHPKDHQL